MAAFNKENIRVGEFLVDNKIITSEQLKDALDMQKYNPDRLVGEILVTQGVLTKENLVMALQMYLVATETQPQHVDEWLDQEEIDIIIERLRKKG